MLKWCKHAQGTKTRQNARITTTDFVHDEVPPSKQEIRSLYLLVFHREMLQISWYIPIKSPTPKIETV